MGSHCTNGLASWYQICGHWSGHEDTLPLSPTWLYCLLHFSTQSSVLVSKSCKGGRCVHLVRLASHSNSKCIWSPISCWYTSDIVEAIFLLPDMSLRWFSALPLPVDLWGLFGSSVLRRNELAIGHVVDQWCFYAMCGKYYFDQLVLKLKENIGWLVTNITSSL